MKHAAFATALLVTSSLVQAADLQVGLSNETAEVIYRSQLSTRASASAGWLHHEDDGDLFTVGFYGNGQQGNISGRVGGQFFFVDADENDRRDGEGHGIALGGDIRYGFGKRFAVEGELFYAPSVTSFRDVENLLIAGVRVTAEVFDGTHVFAGYRNVEVEVDDDIDSNIHEGGYLGVRISF